MADFTALKTAIQNAIKQNGNEEITGNILQDVLLAIVTTLGEGNINDLISALNSESAARQLADSTLQGQINTVSSAITAINYAITNGCVYAGIATPSSTPASGKVFYLALTAGTYTNYGGLEVPQGINILKNNGSAWSLDAFVGIDTEIVSGSKNITESGAVHNAIVDIPLTNLYLEQYSIIKEKYPANDGTLHTASGITSFCHVLKVPENKKFLLLYEASSAVVNFGILFSNDPTFDTIDSYITPYTVDGGKKIINVPDNINYICFGVGLILAVNGKDSIDKINTYQDEAIKGFNSFTPLVKNSAAKGYLKSDGTFNSTTSNGFGIIFYEVSPGQIFYLQQNVLGVNYGFYAFTDIAATTGYSRISFVATNPGTRQKITVPYGAKYLVINTGNNYAYAEAVDIPDSISIIGYPKLNTDAIVPVSVYNYNTGYHYSNRSAAAGNNDILLSGAKTSGNVFSSIGVYDYTQFNLSGNTVIIYIPNSKFRAKLKNDRQLRISFDVVCSASKTVKFLLYHYNFQHIDVSYSLSENVVKHIDYVFPQISAEDIQAAGDISLFANASGSSQLYIANLIITDEVNEGKNIIPRFEADWTHKVIDQPNSYKQCIYIGDSISTANAYKWKQYIEETYKISYVRDGSGLNPANGGIPVVPNMADESSKPNENKSIWYRCAANRMGGKVFDIISLFGGTNDHDCVIGTINDTPYVDDASSFDTPANYTDVWTDSLTLAQCLMGCVEMLMRDFPDKLLVLVTVYPSDTTSIGSPERTLAKATLQCKIGQKYNIPVVPLYWKMREDAIDAFTLDGVHPNTVWARQMAIAFAEVLEF